MPETLPKDLLAQRIEDWYSGVSIDLTGEILEARQNAIEAMAQTLTIKTTPDVVAYAHGHTEFASTVMQWISSHGQKFDVDFTPKGTGREPRVMTACAIAHRLATDPDGHLSTVCSLLIHSAAFRGYKTSARSQNLVSIANRQLGTAATNASDMPPPAKVSAVEKVNTAFKERGEAPVGGGEGSGLAEWLTALKSTVDMLAMRHDAVQRRLVRVAATARQGLDQVAWLLDDYCELGDRPWPETKDAAAILAGAELAAITQTPSMPQAEVMVRSTLVKADRSPSHEMKPVTAVQRAASHLDVWPGGHGHLLLPLSAALDAWKERSEGASGWRDLAKAKRGGGELTNKTEAEIADQAFREFLIARRLDEYRD